MCNLWAYFEYSQWPTKSQQHYAQWIKPVLKGHIMCYSIYRTFLNWLNYRDAKKISGCQKLKTKGKNYMTIKKDPYVNGIVAYLDSSSEVNLYM